MISAVLTNHRYGSHAHITWIYLIDDLYFVYFLYCDHTKQTDLHTAQIKPQFLTRPNPDSWHPNYLRPFQFVGYTYCACGMDPEGVNNHITSEPTYMRQLPLLCTNFPA